MYVLFYKAKGQLLDRIIRLVTKSKYSHVEIFSNGYIYSSSPRDGGVRRKAFNLALNTSKWDYLPIDLKVERLENFYTKTVNKKYDWLGVLRFILPFFKQNKNRYFCSEWVGECLRYSQPELLTPQDLYNLIKNND